MYGTKNRRPNLSLDLFRRGHGRPRNSGVGTSGGHRSRSGDKLPHLLTPSPFVLRCTDFVPDSVLAQRPGVEGQERPSLPFYIPSPNHGRGVFFSSRRPNVSGPARSYPSHLPHHVQRESVSEPRGPVRRRRISEERITVWTSISSSHSGSPSWSLSPS